MKSSDSARSSERSAPSTSDLVSPNCQTESPDAVASVSSAVDDRQARGRRAAGRGPTSSVTQVPAVSAISGERPA